MNPDQAYGPLIFPGLSTVLSLPPMWQMVAGALGTAGSVSVALGSHVSSIVRKDRSYDMCLLCALLRGLLRALLPQNRKSVDGPWGEVRKAERARPF